MERFSLGSIGDANHCGLIAILRNGVVDIRETPNVQAQILLYEWHSGGETERLISPVAKGAPQMTTFEGVVSKRNPRPALKNQEWDTRPLLTMTTFGWARHEAGEKVN